MILESTKFTKWKSMTAMAHWLCRSGLSLQSIDVIKELMNNETHGILGRKMMINF